MAFHRDATPRAKAKWDDDRRDKFLLQELLAQVQLGERANSGFSKKAWAAVTNAFIVEFRVQHTKEQLKSRLQIVSYISFISSSVQSD